MSDLNGTIERVTEIAPSNDDEISLTDGFHVNGEGDIRFLDAKGNDRTLAVLAGISYPYRIKKVFETDTTATGIHALYF